LSGKEVIKALSKVGFETIRQRGSHVIMAKQTVQGKIPLVVPMHSEIDRGTLLEIIRQAKMSKDEFLELF
jgi:predicted RNA binding protein YcfA (HicA-like mRNA interferase family)